MKLNFWQILGIIIVGIALIAIMRREGSDRNRPPQPTPEFSPGRAVEMPSTAPALDDVPATQLAP